MTSKQFDALFSRKSDEWSTPQEFFDQLQAKLGVRFTLDPCATAENAKCPKFITKEQNGLTWAWKGEIVFCNPPYSAIRQWTKKAYEEAQTGVAVAMLVPSRTDTKWWHDYAMHAHAFMFVKGRLKFGDAKNSAPFPSVVVYFNGPSPSDGPVASW